MSTISIGSTNVLSVFKGTTAIKSVYKGAVKLLDFFSPLNLFANGEQGVWYEPSTTTAFLSTTDLTPCTYGQACGFLLDKSQGAGYSGGSFTGLGSELVTNGDFATNDLTGWTDASSGGTVTVSNEEVTLSRTAGTARLRQTVSVTPGKTYLISFDLVNTNPQNRGGLYVGSTGPATNDLIPGWLPKQGNNSFIVTAPTSFIYFTFYTENIGFDPIFDNISVKELPGNHATQTTFEARPTLARVPKGGRRNLLERTEEFDNNAYWTRQANVSVTPDSALAPDGSMTADLVTTSGSTNRRITYTVSSIDGASSHVGSIYVKSVSGPASFEVGLGGLTAKTITTNWQRIETNVLSAGATSTTFQLRFADGSEVLIWGAQLETGSSATAYQKVVDEYDITEAGVDSLDYLSFDGINDGMATAAIDFTSTDKMSVFAGVRKLSDAAVGQLVELSASAPFSNGAFSMPASVNGPDWGVYVKGTASFKFAEATGITAPITTVNTGLYDLGLATGEAKIRIDGVLEATSAGDAGGGNFGNYPLNIGARNNAASLSFNGHIYGLIVRNATSTTDEISNTETYLANRVGFYATTITGVPTIGVS